MIKFIADIGSNHGQDWERTASLVRAAKAIGCQAVKFQLFAADRLFAPEFPANREGMRSRELPPDFVPRIAELCQAEGIEFHCTPFHIEAVAALAPHVDALKIASYSILDLKLIEACARTGKPVTLSAGNCTDAELQDAFLAARVVNHRVTVMHCAAVYPAPPSLCNVGKILAYRNKYHDVGWSDHSRSTAVVCAAVAMGARVVEFHLDLDGQGAEYGHGHCWLPSEASQMMAAAILAREAVFHADIKRIAENAAAIARWRNDPDDEMRPLRAHRQELAGNRRYNV